MLLPSTDQWSLSLSWAAAARGQRETAGALTSVIQACCEFTQFATADFILRKKTFVMCSKAMSVLILRLFALPLRLRLDHLHGNIMAIIVIYGVLLFLYGIFLIILALP